MLFSFFMVFFFDSYDSDGLQTGREAAHGFGHVLVLDDRPVNVADAGRCGPTRLIIVEKDQSIHSSHLAKIRSRYASRKAHEN